MFEKTLLIKRAIFLIPFAIIVASLAVSMYLVFNTDQLLASKSTTKQFVAGANCPAPTHTFSERADKEINFVGCGGFF